MKECRKNIEYAKRVEKLICSNGIVKGKEKEKTYLTPEIIRKLDKGKQRRSNFTTFVNEHQKECSDKSLKLTDESAIKKQIAQRCVDSDFAMDVICDSLQIDVDELNRLTGEYYVYFIQDGKGFMKIGIAKSVDRRLDMLQTANSEKLNVFCKINFKNKDVALKVETGLHRLFRYCNVRREWFKEDYVIEFLNNGQIAIDEHTVPAMNGNISFPVSKLQSEKVRRMVGSNGCYYGEQAENGSSIYD